MRTLLLFYIRPTDTSSWWVWPHPFQVHNTCYNQEDWSLALQSFQLTTRANVSCLSHFVISLSKLTTVTYYIRSILYFPTFLRPSSSSIMSPSFSQLQDSLPAYSSACMVHGALTDQSFPLGAVGLPFSVGWKAAWQSWNWLAILSCMRFIFSARILVHCIS